MNDDEKADIIDKILGEIKSACVIEGKPFDAGDMFFRLAFCEDNNLLQIAKGLRIGREKGAR